MTGRTEDGASAEGLDADLRRLRETLRERPAPMFDEAAARRAFRARGAATWRARRGSAGRVPLWISAAALASSLATAAWVAWPRAGGAPLPEPSAVPRGAPAAPLPQAQTQVAGSRAPQFAEPRPAPVVFQPLPYGSTLSPTASYSVIRVRIPLSSLVAGAGVDGVVEADLLVGEDGRASAIRFADEHTLLVSTGLR